MRNRIGWTVFSPMTYILAASVPIKPPSPKVLATADNQIDLEVFEPLDNGGSIVTKFEVYMDSGTGYGLISTITYNLGSVFSVAVTADKDGTALVPGKKYYFKYLAYNIKGSSDYSNEIVSAASPLPVAPFAPTKVNSKSSLKSIYVQWATVTDPSSPVTGYKLYMDEGNNGNFKMIFDGTGKPGIVGYLVQDLVTGTAYRFKVRAVNFNGESPESAETTLYACLPPLELDAPKYVTSTETTLTVNWRLPQILNGCPIFKYKLYRDNGDNGDINILVNEYEPHISQDTVTLTVADTSKSFRLQVEALNNAGSIKSGVALFVLSNVPEKPTSPVQNDPSVTNDEKIKVTYGVPLPNGRGSQIISIEL